MSTIDRFLKYVDKISSSTGCWLWTGSKNTYGYGRFRYFGKLNGAHRVSWLLFNTTPINDLCVLHTCDTPSCVNPSHLWLGTQQDNMNDRGSKDRCAHLIGDLHPLRKNPSLAAHGDRNGSRKYRERMPRGENNASAKLSEDKVVQIRTLYFNGHTQRELALIFGVSKSLIYAIVNHKIWTHI